MILAANLHHYDSYYYYDVPAKIKHEEEFTTILETPPKKPIGLHFALSVMKRPSLHWLNG